MPDDETVAQMYGLEYQAGFESDPAVDDPKEPDLRLKWLKKLCTGTFVDYGCGSGTLLTAAAALGWRAMGVEYDSQVAAQTERRTGLKVVTDPLSLMEHNQPPADALHLGDVIEHLTAVDAQMPAILRLLKPGGTLLAQGPLEGGPTLFTLGLRLIHTLDRDRQTQMAPYHVLLATVKGQRSFFHRFGFEELEYSIREVSWPAPSRLRPRDLRRPRSLALFALRRLSQASRGLQPHRWGNRYYYAGRWTGAAV
jgi:SAM-dependent methyltransferase